MIRQDIVLGDYIYIADLYKANIDKEYANVYSNFVMLRKFKTENNITYDTDIYFIERELMKEISEDFKSSQTSDKIVFPINLNSNKCFNNKYTNFDSNFTSETLSYDSDNDEFGKDIYEIYDENQKIANVLCDVMRIYHPSNKPHINSIIYIDNYISDIHFHYLCNLYNNQSYNTENDFIVNNNSYSEYTEVKIPNIEYLFDNLYFKENMNLTNSVNNISEIYKYDFGVSESSSLNNQYMLLNALLTPFTINKVTINDEEVYIKNYLKSDIKHFNNYLTAPITLTIAPYDSINTALGTYVLNTDDLVMNSDTFAVSYHFTLSSKMGFNEGIISIINIFDYPNKDKFANVQEAYKTYFSVDEEMYKLYPYIGLTFDELCNCVANDITIYEKIDDDFVIFDGDISLFTTYGVTFENNKYFRNITDTNEEYGNALSFNTDIKTCGYHIIIASDRNFQNIIYSLDINEDFIDDYAFQLNGLFDKWENMPELLVIQTIFVDKYLNEYIYGNDVFITKEWFKYFINNTETYRLKCLSKKLLTDMKYTNDELNGFNFIDKINCVINKSSNSETTSSNTVNISRSANARIIYKPIFYRTQQLQNLRIRSTLSQNIGINLGDYLSKVDMFKLVINGNTFTEYARNDIFVIFKVNASLISATSGSYFITDGDGEYISDGYYSIY